MNFYKKETIKGLKKCNKINAYYIYYKKPRGIIWWKVKDYFISISQMEQVRKQLYLLGCDTKIKEVII